MLRSKRLPIQGLGRYWSGLGWSWDGPGVRGGGGSRSCLGAVLARSWGCPGEVWGGPGAVWGGPGSGLGLSGAVLRRSWEQVSKGWAWRMCKIPCTCQSKQAVGELEELDLGEELEQANVQDPSRLSVETSCRELEERDLGEEREQANVEDPSHLSVETSCRAPVETTATQIGPMSKLT